MERTDRGGERGEQLRTLQFSFYLQRNALCDAARGDSDDWFPFLVGRSPIGHSLKQAGLFAMLNNAPLRSRFCKLLSESRPSGRRPNSSPRSFLPASLPTGDNHNKNHRGFSPPTTHPSPTLPTLPPPPL